MAIVVVLGFSIISIGIQKGLERVTKVMMMALIVLMFLLSLHSMTLSGGGAGLRFYLVPDFDRMLEIGVGNVIVGAMNQSFFTLSLGIGAMAIFGSYIGKERALMGEAVRVSLLDTMVALCSGLIIFPACFAYGVDVNSGPALIFMTLPKCSTTLPWSVLGTWFFLFMTFAAFSTVLAVFENIVCCVGELTLWSRKKACLICCIGIFLLSLPCLLGYNLWSGVRPIAGHDILDSEDFMVSNVMLPLAPPCSYVLHRPLRLGLEELHGRGQRGYGSEGGAVDAPLHDLCAAGDCPCDLYHRPGGLLRIRLYKERAVPLSASPFP